MSWTSFRFSALSLTLVMLLSGATWARDLSKDDLGKGFAVVFGFAVVISIAECIPSTLVGLVLAILGLRAKGRRAPVLSWVLGLLGGGLVVPFTLFMLQIMDWIPPDLVVPAQCFVPGLLAAAIATLFSRQSLPAGVD